MDWNRVLKEISSTLVIAAKEASARQKKETPSVRRTRANQCMFWDCGTPIRSDHILCREHYAELQDGLIDECGGCGRTKYSKYEVCLDCYNPNGCLFWDCDVSIDQDYIFCYNHFEEFRDGRIDECPACGAAKYRQYEV